MGRLVELNQQLLLNFVKKIPTTVEKRNKKFFTFFIFFINDTTPSSTTVEQPGTDMSPAGNRTRASTMGAKHSSKEVSYALGSVVDQDSLESRSGLIGESGSGFRSRLLPIKTLKMINLKKVQ
jgi:hypothetical protein